MANGEVGAHPLWYEPRKTSEPMNQKREVIETRKGKFRENRIEKGRSQKKEKRLFNLCLNLAVYNVLMLI